jgi:hypothetical protein
VEFGTHEELMDLNGRYRYLYGLQTDALADGPTLSGNGMGSSDVSSYTTESEMD